VRVLAGLQLGGMQYGLTALLFPIIGASRQSKNSAGFS
jgi:hypothetical protein